MNLRESLDIIKKYWDAAPVPVDLIARALGLMVLRVDYPDNISGAITKVLGGDDYQILVNRNHAMTRQRFTIAHEIGHYIYHRTLLDGGTGDTRAYRADGTPFPNPKITAAQEQQANTFAANLLMPNHLIKKLQAEGVKTPEDLAQRLQVSVQAMKIRLGTGKQPVDQEEPDDNGDWKLRFRR